MDAELFELCKEVYKRTGWNNQELLGGWIQDQFDGPENRGTFTTRDQIETILFKLICPLYTSDYLLEKLPPIVLTNDDPYEAKWIAGTYGWYDGIGWIEKEVADAPLKALLKLVIALDYAGELK